MKIVIPALIFASLVGGSSAAQALQADRDDAQPYDVPPVPIEDLSVNGGWIAEDSLKLNWSAPAHEDLMLESQGPASQYEIYVSTGPIEGDGSNLASATLVEASTGLTPRTPGEAEELAVYGFDPGSTYYFAIRSKGNYYWSALNTNGPVSGTTYAPPPPSPSPRPSPGPESGGNGSSGGCGGSASACVGTLFTVALLSMMGRR